MTSPESSSGKRDRVFHGLYFAAPGLMLVADIDFWFQWCRLAVRRFLPVTSNTVSFLENASFVELQSQSFLIVVPISGQGECAAS